MSTDHTHDETPPRALTAFFVIVPEDGSTPYATIDVNPHTQLIRNPTPGDVRRACQDVVHDINAKAAAEYVLKAQQEAKPEPTSERVRRARQRREEEK